MKNVTLEPAMAAAFANTTTARRVDKIRNAYQGTASTGSVATTIAAGNVTLVRPRKKVQAPMVFAVPSLRRSIRMPNAQPRIVRVLHPDAPSILALRSSIVRRRLLASATNASAMPGIPEEA